MSIIEAEVKPVGSKATLFVVAAILLCFMTVVAVVTLIALGPNEDTTKNIAIIVGITTPITSSLIMLTVQQTHLAVNSRMDEFKRLLESVSIRERNDH